MRYLAASVGLGAVMAILAGCGGGEPKVVPNVRGERLDLAERRLEDAGLDVEEVGGGVLGIVVRSNWTVCQQEPAPGAKARTVRLVVARDCPTPPPAPRIVPDLYGEDLEEAEELLGRLGIGYDVEDAEGDEEPFVERFWEVCDQSPAPGTRADFVVLYVERICG